MLGLPNKNTDRAIFVLIQSSIGEETFNSNEDVHRFENLSELSVKKLRQIAPTIILCPLYSYKFDVIDVGKMVIKAGLDAKVLIDGPRLPRPKMVMREISAACPGLRFEFFEHQRWMTRCLEPA